MVLPCMAMNLVTYDPILTARLDVLRVVNQ